MDRQRGELLYEGKAKRVYAWEGGQYLKALGVELIDFKLEYGTTGDGRLLPGDEISPDTSRFWDSATRDRLDKDRFRRDLSDVEGAYREVYRRVTGREA